MKVLIFLLMTAITWGFLVLSSPARKLTHQETSLTKEIKHITAEAPNLNPEVLKLGLNAYQKAREKGLDKKQVLTLIDYSKPSTAPRLWVIDMKKEKVLFTTYVAHGKNSGGLHATSFSNKPRSLKSSFGVFLTDETYSGHHGYSLRIKGLEPQNDNVYKRQVVFHGAEYVSESVGKVKGMMGRSWGCMAVNPRVIGPLIDTIKNKTLVFAYFPDHYWLTHSSFLTY